MPLVTIAIVVLTAWGVGAAAGSAADYLTGAMIGAVTAVVLLAILGMVSARRHPTERPQDLKPY